MHLEQISDPLFRVQTLQLLGQAKQVYGEDDIY